MDLIHQNTKKIYFRYLAAAFGSSLISTIYGLVDSIVVGQYSGPKGSAARAVMAPVWNIVFAFGLLFGIGGSVFFGHIRGKDKRERKESDGYFTVSLIGALFASLLSRAVFFFFDKPRFTALGADEEILALCEEYLKPVKLAIPFYLFSQVLAAFLRNDHAPTLATIAVLVGGVVNVFGDLYFVFGLNRGLFGAGLATALGNTLSVLLRLIHFFRKKNTLGLVPPTHFFAKLGRIREGGFSAGFVDRARGIITALLNNQIRKYLGSDALAVYGVIVYRSTCVQCCAYSVGQAAQPILSANLGAGKPKRIKEVLRYSLFSCAFFGILWTLVRCLFPKQIVDLRRDATNEVLAISGKIIILYSLSFLLLPFNIFSTYYFQSIRHPRTSLLLSLLRGAILCTLFILLLPLVWGERGIWLSRPLTELVTSFAVVYFRVYWTRRLPKETTISSVSP